MNSSAKHFVAATIAACLTCLGGCEGGTSSETVGVVEVVEATPSADQIAVRTDAGSNVGLYSADFLPYSNSGFAKSVTADSNGMALFSHLDPGEYHVVVQQISSGKAALILDLVVPASGSTATTARARLEATGSLAGVITDSLLAFAGVAYVPGTPFFAIGDSLMRYEFHGLPQGTYPVVKSWRKPLACNPTAACGGSVLVRDSALVQIHTGEKAIW